MAHFLSSPNSIDDGVVTCSHQDGSSSVDSSNSGVLKYRITGPHSIERMDPLLKHYCSSKLGCRAESAATPASVGMMPCGPNGNISSPLAFVWETSCEKSWRDVHSSAIVLNKLHNAIIIEDKANLAFLQILMNCPTLPTFVCRNISEITSFYNKHLDSLGEIGVDCSAVSSIDDSNEQRQQELNTGKDWWVIKASKGNGGRDIWMMNRRNGRALISSLPGDEEYVVQKYVFKPKLWNNKKFHFRCYGLLQSDNTAYLYKIAYVLTAGMDYSCEDEDSSRHISNLSVNKRFLDHPGQIPCDLTCSPEVPGAFEGIATLWKECCTAAGVFMAEQRSPHHFDFYGFDVIMDESGRCWLIELNRLPGLESSSNNKVEEDIMYDTMMTNLLDIVMQPLNSRFCCQSSDSNSGNSNNKSDNKNSSSSSSSNGFMKVKDANPSSNCSSSTLFKNIFLWKAFTTKHKNQIMFEPR